MRVLVFRWAQRAILVSTCFICVGLIRAPARAETPVAPTTIRIAIYDDAGATKADVRQIEGCLPVSQGFQVETVTADEIRDGALKKFDVVIHPGGAASKQGNTLDEKGREMEKQFVADGGGFIGICAGAYLASAQYPWLLHILDAKVIDGKHWARGQGNVQLRISSAGQTALNADRETCTIHYENGPLLAPGGNDDIEDYELLAAYETEMATNGAPAGVMKGTTAIARGKFGKGHVVCFSPHPEKTPGREPFLQSAARWAAGGSAARSGEHNEPRSGDRRERQCE